MIHRRGLRCEAEHHLWSSGLELAIYQKTRAVTWVKSRGVYGDYYGTIQGIADYLGVRRESASRAIGNLIKSGWLEIVERKDDEKSGHAIKAELLGTKRLHPVTHEEWTNTHTDARCFKSDAMPWDGEPKDRLALALHRESHGNVKWYANLITSLRKTGASDAEIERAYHEHVSGLEKEPSRRRGWQTDAGYWIVEFRKSHRSAA